MENYKEYETRNNDEIEIDLSELIKLMLQKLWIIILCFIIGGALAFGATKILITPQYSSSSMIYILTQTEEQSLLSDVQVGEKLTVDFITLAKSRPVIEAVNEELGLGYSYEKLEKMVNVENPEDTRILKFTATHEDPEVARDIANAMAEAAIERVASVMNTDEPNIVEEAVAAKKPSSPSVMKNTAIGAMLGAILAMALILIRFLMNDTIQTEEDVRKYLDLHTLAAIPLEKRRGR